MVTDKLSHARKILAWSLVLIGLTCQPLMAATIFDLQETQPLGAVSVNASGDQAYFSLGNGRALLIPLATNAFARGPAVREISLKEAEKVKAARPVATRNSKRNLKW